MANALKLREGFFNYGLYKAWPEGERWELIHGEAFDMSPAANRRHQGILTNLAGRFIPFFVDRPCKVYLAPFDVLLPADAGQDDDSVDTVVQPDLLVICTAAKLTDQGCRGAPDFVLEILSPSTAFKDLGVKLNLYEAHGVKEYWLVNPGNSTILVYQNSRGRGFNKPLSFGLRETLEPVLFPGLTVKLNDVFGE